MRIFDLNIPDTDKSNTNIHVQFGDSYKINALNENKLSEFWVIQLQHLHDEL